MPTKKALTTPVATSTWQDRRKTFKTSTNVRAAQEQDRAAGGAQMRVLHTRSGDTVTVSLVPEQSSKGWRITLRFKLVVTVQRPVGLVQASTRQEALERGWRLVRESKIAEQNGWSWAEGSDGH
jgi:hypothetical protein